MASVTRPSHKVGGRAGRTWRLPGGRGKLHHPQSLNRVRRCRRLSSRTPFSTRRTAGQPFDPPRSGKIVVKVINLFGGEVLEAYPVPTPGSGKSQSTDPAECSGRRVRGASMERQLRDDKLLDTAEKVRQRITERFPDSGLSQVAAEIIQITREAIGRAEAISRPNLWIRGGQVLLLLIAVAGVVVYTQTRADQKPLVQTVLEFLDVTKGSAAILAATAIFLFTLETRLKRRRALRAVHELRAMAHLIDMHQLTKDPDRLGHPTEPINVGGRPMDAEAVGRYLHFCTELLAIVSKVGQLYVQDFPDAAAVTAVDHFEGLATGLSNKIWQKLMILDRIRSDAESDKADNLPTTTGTTSERAASPTP
jgi:hypothetical protein